MEATRAGSPEEAQVKQFEIWWARLSAPLGRRPVLLLTRNEAYGYLSHVVVAPVTTRIRNIPMEVALDRAEGLPTSSVANLDNVTAVAKDDFESRIGVLSRSRHVEVKRALGWAFDWRESKEAG